MIVADGAAVAVAVVESVWKNDARVAAAADVVGIVFSKNEICCEGSEMENDDEEGDDTGSM